jgi:hypothetical protein
MRGKQRGVLAIVVAIMLVVVVAMGAAMFAMSTSGNRGAGDHAQSGRALFLAESGIEWAAKELLGADNPEGDCNGLAGSGPFTMPGGTFRIIDAVYDDTAITCRVTSRGTVGNAVRTIAGTVPRTIILGSGSIFENEGAWDLQWAQFVEPLVLEMRSNPACQNQSEAVVETPSQVLSDSFEAGDQVYFATGFEVVTGDVSISTLEVVLEGAASCTVPMATPGTSPCAAAPGHPLYDYYDIVLDLGNTFGVPDIDSIELIAQWKTVPGPGPPSECAVRLSEACIGREAHCTPGDSDPVDDWSEVP